MALAFPATPIQHSNNTNTTDLYTLITESNVFADQGKYDKAIISLDKALSIDPNDKYSLNTKGNSLFGIENYTEDLKFYDKALSIDPSNLYAIKGKNLIHKLIDDVKG